MSARVDLAVKQQLEAMHREQVAMTECADGDLECGDLSPPFLAATYPGGFGNKSPNEKAATSRRASSRTLSFEADFEDEEILQPRRLSLRVF